MKERFSTTLQALAEGLRGAVSEYMQGSGTASRHAVLTDIVHTNFLQSLDLTLRKSLEHFQFHTNTGSGSGGDEANRHINEDIREVVQHIEKHAIAIEQNISSTNTMLFDNNLSQAQQDMIDHLPYVHARHDCATRNGAGACLENTRTTVLKEIFEWARDVEARQIYWLHGIAGVGKTTIAHTVATTLDGDGYLGASFFFSRDYADRRNVIHLLPSIAYQLSQSNPNFKRALATCLQRRRDAGAGALPVQIEHLLLKPLQCMGVPSLSFVIVIDALDECESDHIRKLLELISTLVQNIRFIKFFITGRPEHHIFDSFRRPSIRDRTHLFLLHNIDESIVSGDIEIFLRHELREITEDSDFPQSQDPWPSDSDFKKLLSRAGALFIVASTSIKFLSDPIVGNPKELLQSLLTERGEINKSPFKELDDIYYRIVENSVRESNANDYVCRRFRDVIGAVICVVDPLPPAVLGSLIGLSLHDVKSATRLLRSVLILPHDYHSPESGTIRAFHLSFPNFLTERCTDARFAINSALQHLRLAAMCLQTLNSFLRRDICQLPDPLSLNHEVPDLQERLGRAVLPHHRYACKYWAQHLTLSRQVLLVLHGNMDIAQKTSQLLLKLEEALDDELATFVSKKLLQWLEVLSLLGWLDLSIPALKEATSWLELLDQDRIFRPHDDHPRMVLCPNHKPGDMISLLHDAGRFVVYFFRPIKQGASQVYHSALAFAPKKCPISQNYAAELDKSPFVIGGRPASWDNCVCVMNGHTSNIQSVAYSTDCSQIVSGSDDESICIWDAGTGSLIKKLDWQLNHVLSVAFSPDSTQIVSGSLPQTVCVWDVLTGSQIRLWHGGHPNATVHSVSFSDNGKYVISSFSDGTVDIWDTIKGHLVEDIYEPIGTATLSGPVAFSSSKRGQIVGVASGSTIDIRDRVTKTLIKTLQGHTGDVVYMAFSPDGDRIVSGSLDTTVRLWDVARGFLVHQCERERQSAYDAPFQIRADFQIRAPEYSPVRWLQFSGDRVVCLSDIPENAIYIWDSANKYPITELKLHTSRVSSVAVSAESGLLVFGSFNGRLYIWDYNQGNIYEELVPAYFPHLHATTDDEYSDYTISIDQGACVIKNDNWPNGKFLCYYIDYTDAGGSTNTIKTVQRGSRVWVKRGTDEEGDRGQSLDFSRMISAYFS
ncbi:hypothetical protein FRC02_002514 [Tulasnella sp. 418]|nr:hypothetical protein FRC02_002514 [Tulasnella sp. 418]